MAWDDTIPWFRRVLPGAVLVGAGLFLLHEIGGGDADEIVATVFKALIGLGLMLAGAVLVARPLAHLIVTPFVRMLFPEDHHYTPPPLFPLARHYWKQGRGEDAVKQYQKILKYHPQEADAYKELAQLFLSLDRRREADAVVRKGCVTLRDKAAREDLYQFYSALVAGGVLTTEHEERSGLP